MKKNPPCCPNGCCVGHLECYIARQTAYLCHARRTKVALFNFGYYRTLAAAAGAAMYILRCAAYARRFSSYSMRAHTQSTLYTLSRVLSSSFQRLFKCARSYSNNSSHCLASRHHIYAFFPYFSSNKFLFSCLFLLL